MLWQCEGGHELERALHGHLSRFRAGGEWFDFGDADPIDKISEALQQLGSPEFTAGRFTEAVAEREILRHELAAAIRQAAADDVPQKDICEATGYTRQQVRRIVLAGESETVSDS